MNYSLRHLRYFVAAAEHGAISAGAKKLNVAQPSVSAAIGHLEHAFGVELFVRKPSDGVKLTPAGTSLLKEARLLLSHAADFDAIAANLADAISGEIHVAAFINIAPVYLAAIIRSFKNRYPSVTFRAFAGNQAEVLAAIRSGQFEVAITFDLALTDEFKIDIVHSVPPQLVVPSGHALARAENASLRDVADEPFVILDLPHSRDYFFSLFRSADMRPKEVIEVGSFEAVRAFVGNGFGYSLLNLVPKNNATYDGTQVRYIPLTDDVRPLKVCCVRLRNATSRRACAAFVEHVQSFFASGRA